MFKNGYAFIYSININKFTLPIFILQEGLKFPIHKSNYSIPTFVMKDIIILRLQKKLLLVSSFNKLGINSDIPNRLTGNSRNTEKVFSIMREHFCLNLCNHRFVFFTFPGLQK